MGGGGEGWNALFDATVNNASLQSLRMKPSKKIESARN